MKDATQTVAVEGHFGEWLQGVLGPEGPVALVTLPCPALTLRLSYTPAEVLQVDLGTPPLLTAERFAEARARFGLPARGAYRMRANMPPGGGAGASTAALVALARLGGVEEATLLHEVNQVEGATDPLTLSRPEEHLWAPRTARVLETLPPVPSFEVVGGFQRSPVWTDPKDTRFVNLSTTLPAWREACSTHDLAACAALASETARANSVLRGDDPSLWEDLASDLGALGWVRANTCSAVGWLFAPGNVPDHAPEVLRNAGLTQIMTFHTGARACSPR